jgi:hypothetical protein
VVRRQNDGTVIDHSFAVHDAKPEKNPSGQFDEVVAKPVVRIHRIIERSDD